MQADIKSDWESELRFRADQKVPVELEDYFDALRIAAMHYEKNHDAATRWTQTAYDRLTVALKLHHYVCAMYLDRTVAANAFDFEDLPRARTWERRTKSQITADVLKRHSEKAP